MSKIVSIGTAVPVHRHRQEDILRFMQQIFAMNEEEKRKLKFLYHQSGIVSRHSVIADYSKNIHDWKFYPQSENLEPVPSLEQRMAWYNKHAGPLSVDAIRDCLQNKAHEKEITHLITVSCTGMSAPGLDLQVLELMDLPKNIFRTSVNFMGCYAAIHAIKIADAICRSDPHACVLVVCTELCTLHFQREATMDNIASSLLFADGSAALMIRGDDHPAKGMRLQSFYSQVLPKGKKDMAWELSSTGFLMTLSSYVPHLIEEDFASLTDQALQQAKLQKKDITHWCIHPGGKKILEAIAKSLCLGDDSLMDCFQVLQAHGNMSSPTLLFVLKRMFDRMEFNKDSRIFGAAFGPGLTMETFVASA